MKKVPALWDENVACNWVPNKCYGVCSVMGGGGGIYVLNIKVHGVVLNGQQVSSLLGGEPKSQSLVLLAGNKNMNLYLREEAFQQFIPSL